MYTFISPQKEDLMKELILTEGIQESIYPDLHEINITDGSEFLDDGIRMKDQPFGEQTIKKDK
jgi:hypothetical protein